MSKKKKESIAISISQMKKLRKDLKSLDQGWVKLLVDQIKGDPFVSDEFKNINDKRVYNIFSGTIKNKVWRLKLYHEANSLKNQLEKKLVEIVN